MIQRLSAADGIQDDPRLHCELFHEPELLRRAHCVPKSLALMNSHPSSKEGFHVIGVVTSRWRITITSERLTCWAVPHAFRHDLGHGPVEVVRVVADADCMQVNRLKRRAEGEANGKSCSRTAAPARNNNMVKCHRAAAVVTFCMCPCLLQLMAELIHRIDVSPGTKAIRTTDGNAVGPLPLLLLEIVRQSLHHRVGPNMRILLRRASVDGAANHAVNEDVANGSKAIRRDAILQGGCWCCCAGTRCIDVICSMRSQNEMGLHAQHARRSRRGSAVIALLATDRDDGLVTLRARFRQEKLQLSHLVAAQFHPAAHVITLDPKLDVVLSQSAKDCGVLGDIILWRRCDLIHWGWKIPQRQPAVGGEVLELALGPSRKSVRCGRSQR
mmetsp:Transcript_7937/g.21453  ORF Transcript_7937/g.21453 Transcript_7937/m.21453 type:complete len:385 (+) Transcript_7937:755-1909(+)